MPNNWYQIFCFKRRNIPSVFPFPVTWTSLWKSNNEGIWSGIWEVILFLHTGIIITRNCGNVNSNANSICNIYNNHGRFFMYTCRFRLWLSFLGNNLRRKPPRYHDYYSKIRFFYSPFGEYHYLDWLRRQNIIERRKFKSKLVNWLRI